MSSHPHPILTPLILNLLTQWPTTLNPYVTLTLLSHLLAPEGDLEVGVVVVGGEVRGVELGEGMEKGALRV